MALKNLRDMPRGTAHMRPSFVCGSVSQGKKWHFLRGFLPFLRFIQDLREVGITAI